MKLVIKGGALEAEVVETPEEKVYKQIIGTLMNETKGEIGVIKNALGNVVFSNRVTSINQSKALNSIRQDLQSMSDIVNDTEQSLGAKIQEETKNHEARIKELTDKISKIKSRPTVTKVKTVVRTITKRPAPKKEADVAREKIRRADYPKETPVKKEGVVDGTKFMGKLNFEPKLPI